MRFNRHYVQLAVDESERALERVRLMREQAQFQPPFGQRPTQIDLRERFPYFRG